ncbi:pectinesterase precursor [Aspergillus luchuensis]|uniref:Pectinesterase n=1 Tax=Aspergillus kawachii TaxID=1069201 RepID=A0A146G253_ASPKA|nr:pectinesterase precursor [Aspergillus luchuensis]
MGSSMPLVGHSLAIFICAAVMMSVSIMAVALRTFVRIYTVRAFGWDDALMVIALVGFLIVSQTRQQLMFN